jgi:hypothetical protein
MLVSDSTSNIIQTQKHVDQLIISAGTDLGVQGLESR